MNNTHYTIEHAKGQHLSLEERGIIQSHLRDGWNINQIAKDLKRPYNTIKNEVKRGTVELYDGKVTRYKASEGEKQYKLNRKNSKRNIKCLEVLPFIKWVEEQFMGENKWSLDACVGYSLESGLFARKDIVCTKTLYNYVDNGLVRVKNINLPEKLRRNTKLKKSRTNKKNLGKSIEERPKHIEERKEFGHWEFDSVLGNKSFDQPVVITMVERMTRNSLWIKAENHSAEAMTKAFEQVKNMFKEQFSQVFKSITADNGSEFSDLTESSPTDTETYFTHPFSSWEKGTNECHNKLLRRFIPKKKSISDYSADDIMFFADWSNGLPRKILGYKTPEQLFEQELNKIYCA